MGGTGGEGCLHAACGWMPARVSMGIMSFLGFVVLTSVRINISVAIVAMVRYNASSTVRNQTECWQPPQSNVSSVATSESVLPAIKVEEEGEDVEAVEEWDEVIQGLVLGSFFYSYAFTQVIGGRLAELYGTRLTFGMCGAASGVLTLFTPLAARSHYGALIAVRSLMGIFQGPMWPSMHALVPCWVPPLERPRFVSVVYFGASLSMMITMALCGVIVDDLGWEAAFYIPGALCLLWTFCWFILTTDSPDQHPRISQQEREYINRMVRASGMSRRRPKGVPWRAMATSLPVWAIIVCDIGNTFGLSVFFSQLPTFMQNVMGFSIKQNGLMSSLPFLCRYVGAVSWSHLADWLVESGRLSVHASRRLFSAIAMFGPAIMVMATAYTGCSPTTIVALLCLTNFLNGAIAASQIINHTDISPNYSGTLFGISNTFSALAMFVAPVCVGAIIRGQQTLGQWRKVFWMCFPMYVLGEIFFLVFCSASVQPWNYQSGQNQDDDPDAEVTTPMVKEDIDSMKPEISAPINT